MKFQLVTFFSLFFFVESYIVDPGPLVKATKGEIWPKPQDVIINDKYYGINSRTFMFKVIGNNCFILREAIIRYWKIIHRSNSFGSEKQLHENNNTCKDSEEFLGYLNYLSVLLIEECKDDQLPNSDMDESYELIIPAEKHMNATLSAQSVWGILRGLETFSQLIYSSDYDNIVINSTRIKDFPRFPHRGLHLDTSRHFMPLYIIFQTMDAMSYNKLNVFHWHIVDDQSFPYQSVKFPALSDKGAYHPVSKIYTQEDIKKVIEFARLRGIRVMPEFDTPGHTRSWGEGIEGILTACYDNDGKPTGQYGPMDPSRDFLYSFLDRFFSEIIEVFPESYLHLGGDEVEFECWESNKALNEFMKKANISDYYELESYFIQKLLKIVTKKGAKALVWEEVFVNGVELPNDTIVHVWKADGYRVLYKVIASGKPAILSACWYLDHLSTGGDWVKFYNCDPYKYFNGSDYEKSLIIGGEACMWAETVNEYNVVSRIWPRASATAEKLWSAQDADIPDNAKRRLEEHACRMNKRGIPAQPPNGPGVCL